MLRVEDTVLILLAAGRSERFGDVGSKLEEEFLGKPLGLHVAGALAVLPFRDRIAVTGRARLDYASRGYREVPNADPGEGMGSSVRIGVAAAKAQGAKAVLIALADMPRVTAAHVMRLYDAAANGDTVVASSDGVDPKPPALFGADKFEFLMALDGDKGARDLVRAGRHVVTNPAELIDIDTPAEMERLRALIGSREARTLAVRRADPIDGE